MKCISQVTFLIFTLALTCCTGCSGRLANLGRVMRDNGEIVPSETVPVVDEEAAIDQLFAAFEDAYNSHDPAAVAALYAEDARWMAAAGLVMEGRETIRTILTQIMTVVPPVLTLNEGDKVIVGDYAVSRGTYVMAGETGEAARAIGGAYLSVLEKAGDGWQIVAQQMNYNVEMSPFMWVGNPEVVKALSEDSPSHPVAETCEAHYNSGDASLMANCFTADAWMSFGGSPWMVGREAIVQSLQIETALSRHLDIQRISTLELGDGLALEVGWYELTESGNSAQWGTYTLLAQQNPEGVWLIHWLVSTGSPSILQAP